MNFRKFFGFAFLLWFLLLMEKILFLNIFSFDNETMRLLYGVILFILTLACVRRLGVINYLEAMLVAGVWFVIILFLDFVVLMGMGIMYYTHWEIWAGYGVMVLTIFFFHKKRHVAIRRELEAHHHGHGTHGAHGEHKAHGDHHQQPHGQHGPGKQHH